MARSGLGEAATTGAATAQSALVHNRAFRDYWTTLVCSNRRKTAPAYRQLLERLARGEEIPGVGTWRDVFAREHGGIHPAPDMACPWSPFTLDAPRGWTLRNLMRHAPARIIGVSQIGKTHSLLEYKRRSEYLVRYVRIPAAPSFKLCVEEIAAACGVTTRCRVDDLRKRTAQALDHNTLLIVDELRALIAILDTQLRRSARRARA